MKPVNIVLLQDWKIVFQNLSISLNSKRKQPCKRQNSWVRVEWKFFAQQSLRSGISILAELEWKTNFTFRFQAVQSHSVTSAHQR